MAVTAFRSDVVILFIVQFRRVWFFYNINLLFRIWYTTHSIYASAFYMEMVDYLLVHLHQLQRKICSEFGSLWLLAFSDLFYFSYDA